MPPAHAGRDHAPRSIAIASMLAVCALAAIPAVMAAGQDNEKQVRICHATNSDTNPYVEQTPAIANNGDLNGGHLGHPDDIIPPYVYVDKDGNTQSYPGKNWDDDGQAIWENGCQPTTPPEPPAPDHAVRPVHRGTRQRLPGPLRLRQSELGRRDAAA
jgi:hypothetical protein